LLSGSGMKLHLRPRGLPALLLDTARRLMANRVIEMSAALAFYSALSLAPLVVISLGVAGLMVDRAVLQTHVVNEADRVLGHGAGDLVRRLAVDQHATGSGTFATVAGVIALLLGASAVFGQLQDGLDRIWEAKPRPRAGVWLFVRKRLASLAMVLSFGFLLLISLLVSAALSMVAARVSTAEGVAANLAHLAASILVSTLLFALIFRVLPDTHVGWAEAWGGGVLTAVLFHAGEWAIGQYLGRASVGSPYGAAGTLVVMLVWVYYSSVIVFAGAEFTHVWSLKRGAKARAAAAGAGPAH
jgi:membrane protein